MRGETLQRLGDIPDRDAVERELGRLRAELARRDDELARLHLALRRHNELGDRLGELDAARQDLQAQLEKAGADAEALAEALAYERRRGASARLLARLSEAAARADESQVRRLEERLEQSRSELEHTREALAAAEQARQQEAIQAGTQLQAVRREREQSDARLQAAGGALRELGQERDAVAARLEAALRRQRMEAFADWMLRPRVAAGLVRRGRAGARRELLSALSSRELSDAVPAEALNRLARPGTIVLLISRAAVSGHARARRAILFRLTGSDE